MLSMETAHKRAKDLKPYGSSVAYRVFLNEAKALNLTVSAAGMPQSAFPQVLEWQWQEI